MNHSVLQRRRDIAGSGLAGRCNAGPGAVGGTRSLPASLQFEPWVAPILDTGAVPGVTANV